MLLSSGGTRVGVGAGLFDGNICVYQALKARVFFILRGPDMCSIVTMKHRVCFALLDK